MGTFCRARGNAPFAELTGGTSIWGSVLVRGLRSLQWAKQFHSVSTPPTGTNCWAEEPHTNGKLAYDRLELIVYLMRVYVYHSHGWVGSSVGPVSRLRQAEW